MSRIKVNIGLLEGLISSLVNVALFVPKIWVGIAVGSIAMIAEAWHTISDTATSLIVLWSFVISEKPSDREHPFGHGRAEAIGALVIGLLLIIVGLNFIKDAMGRLISHVGAPVFSPLSIAVFGFSAVVKEGLAQFSFWAGKKILSKALIADGWHHRSDALGSLLIVVGSVLGKGLWWIDGCMGIVVSLLILWAAVDVMRESAQSLMGEEVDRGLEEKIRAIIREVAPGEVWHIHHLHIHRYGKHREITLHANMDDKTGLRQAHAVATVIEQKLREKLNVEATVHMEPARRG